MYQECAACRSTVGARPGLRKPDRAQPAMCSRLGPEIDVNEANSLAYNGSPTAAQACMDPQSWATTCAGSSGLTARSTATRSSTRCSIRYPSGVAGSPDRPCPRTS
jgi:hypothetical protein